MLEGTQCFEVFQVPYMLAEKSFPAARKADGVLELGPGAEDRWGRVAKKNRQRRVSSCPAHRTRAHPRGHGSPNRRTACKSRGREKESSRQSRSDATSRPRCSSRWVHRSGSRWSSPAHGTARSRTGENEGAYKEEIRPGSCSLARRSQRLQARRDPGVSPGARWALPGFSAALLPRCSGNNSV